MKVGKRPGRRPYLAAEIDLPLPPPTNAAALERRHWLDAAAMAFNAAGMFPLPGVIGVRVIAGIPIEPRDLTEIANTLIALLTDCGVIDDPEVIVDTLARWDRTIKSGRVWLVVRQTKPPRERIGAETRRRASERSRRHAAVGVSA